MKKEKGKSTKGFLKKSITGVIAGALALTMAVGIMQPAVETYAKETVADLDTTTKYSESLGDNASTEYAGRIWTDKTVYDEAKTFEMFGGKTTTVELAEGEDFLVAYSALATGQSISGQETAPVDVVFIIDLSGSMSDSGSGMDNGKSRIYNTTVELNKAITTLMELNPNNRVAVVGFSSDAEILLKLDHYSQYNNNSFFSVSRETPSGNNCTLYTRARGTTSGVVSKNTTVYGGTNIQAGYYMGMNLLASEKNTTIDIGDKKVTRIPSVILLGDGSPTYSSNSANWWEPGNNHSNGSGSSSSARYGNGFKAMMTAAWMKAAIDTNYRVKGTSSATKLYTIGMGLDDISYDTAKSIARVTLNPGEYWNSNSDAAASMRSAWNTYANGSYVNVTVQNNSTYKVNHPTNNSALDAEFIKNYPINSYVDQYYGADDAQAVTDVFESIVSNIAIETAEVPTEIKGKDPMTDGYIIYKDKIGQYMTVKDVKEIIYAGESFTQKTVSTAADGTIQYVFSGEVHSSVYGNQNIDDIIITVETDDDENELLTVKIPASVIPIRVNSVELNADGTVKTHTNNGAYPARVIYSVSLKEEIVKNSNGLKIVDTTKLSEDYISANTNEDGTINFYSNLYNGENMFDGNTLGNTIVEFEPAHTNQFYYMQEDVPIYVKRGELYEKASASSALAPDGDYYILNTYYHGNKVENHYVHRKGSQLTTTALVNKGGYWYRASGSPRLNRIYDFKGEKLVNDTKTADYFYMPTFEYATGSSNAYDGKFVVYLGNNGVMSVTSTGNLEIAKRVVTPAGLNPSEDTFRFTVDFNGITTLEGTYPYTVINANNQKISEGSVSDGGIIQLKDGQKAMISHLPHGTTYKVTEIAVPGFATTTDGNTGGKIVAGRTMSEMFTNIYGVQSVTVPTTDGFSGVKTLTGRDWNNDSFTFVLEGDDISYPMPAGSVNGLKEVTITEDSTHQYVDGEAIGFEFGSILYDKPGTYVYTISEKMPTASDGYLPGMSYSAAIYDVVVNVTDNGEGKLVATTVVTRKNNDAGTRVDEIVTDKSLGFINKYVASSVSWTPVGTKHYTDISDNKHLTDRMFQFKIQPKGENAAVAPMPTGASGTGSDRYFIANNIGTEIAYPQITFTQNMAGNTYTYTFTEVIPTESERIPGMVYDAAAYDVVVSVLPLDSSSNVVKINVTYPEDGSRVNFNNRYEPTPTAVTLIGEKTLSGRNMANGEVYTFKLTAANDMANTLTLPANVTVTGGVDSIAKGFEFEEIQFTKPGNYKFEIQEAVPEGYVEGTKINGVVYDAHSCMVEVAVADQNGVLAVTSITYDNGNASDATNKAVFENVYEAIFDDEPVNLSGAKHLTGKSLLAGEFYFEVTDLTANTKKLVTHEVDETHEGGVYHGTIKFLENVVYTKAGNYEYEIREIIPNPKVVGTSYDESVYRFTVIVTDVESEGENAGNQIGRLYVKSTKLEVKEAGSENWKELERDEKKIIFENTYVPNPITIPISTMHKVISGDSANVVNKAGFEFELTIESANPADGIILPENSTAISDASGNITFGNIKFTKEGTYTIKVSEVIPTTASGIIENADGTYTLDGVTYNAQPITATYRVVDNRNGVLKATIIASSGTRTFTNTYEPNELPVDLTIHKNFTGRVIDGKENVWLETDRFEFETVILDPTTQEALNDGEIVFANVNNEPTRVIDVNNTTKTITGRIIFKKAGKYKFIVREITENPIVGVNYDNTAHEIAVEVIDDGKGSLSYSIKDNGQTFNPKTQKITFNNVYDADSTDISGHDYLKVDKRFTGRENNEWLDSDTFTFELSPDDEATKTALQNKVVRLSGTPEDATGSAILMKETLVVSNQNKAHAHFGSIHFAEAGTYKFNITEIEGSVPGIEYDKTPRKITIDVIDNGKAQLVAAISRDSNPLIFNNTYTTETIKVALDVSKELVGRKWNDSDEFNFKFEAVGETLDAVAAGSVKLPNEKTITLGKTDVKQSTFAEKQFAKIEFTKPGVYKFEIAEIIPSVVNPNVHYAENTVIATVTVTDDTNGNLTAAVVYSDEAPLFTNIYKPNAVETGIKVSKRLDGLQLKTGTFAFRITAVTEGAPMPNNTTVVNGNSGVISEADFGEISYDKSGTYIYEVTEINRGAEGVTYDSGKVIITVNVTYNETAGAFDTPTVTYKKVDANNTEMSDVDVKTFVNSYEAKPVNLIGATNLKITKNFTGRVNDRWKDTDKFTFTLAAADQPTQNAITAGDIVMPATTLEVTINNNANAYFGDILFKQEGTYKFAVNEVVPAGAVNNVLNGITYDSVERIVTVVVSYDDVNGVYNVAVDNANSNPLTFVNSYKTKTTSIELPVIKEFTGREWNDNDKFEFVLEVEDTTTMAALGKGVVLPEETEIAIEKKNYDSVTQTYTNSFDSITFTKAGTYKFHVREVAGDDSKITYDAEKRVVTVTVVDDGNGALVISKVEGVGSIRFTNKYVPEEAILYGHGKLDVTKVFTGREWKDGENFTFKIEPVEAYSNVQITKDTAILEKNAVETHFGNIIFKEVENVPGSAEGTYKFAVKEVYPEGATEENNYTVDGITYDTTVKVVTVVVTYDNESGVYDVAVDGSSDALTFTNTYGTEPVTLKVSDYVYVEKQFEGREWNSEDVFTFRLSASDAVTEAAITANKVILPTPSEILITSQTPEYKSSFGEITFTEPGYYGFVIEEIPGDDNNIAYSTHKIYINVAVTDNGMGELEAAIPTSIIGKDVPFVNTYTPDPISVQFDGVKTISGREFIDSDEFWFKLVSKDNAPIPAVVEVSTNKQSEGEFEFGTIQFSAEGTYEYVIREIVKSSIPGIVYDSEVVTATVVVTFNSQTGQFEKEVTYTKAGTEVENAEFVNIYTPDSTTIALSATKQVNDTANGNYTMAAGDFAFRVVPSEGNPEGDPIAEGVVTNEADGTIYFTDAKTDLFVYTVPGTYTYDIFEANTNVVDCFKYDESVYTVIVEVADDQENAALSAEVSVTKNGNSVDMTSDGIVFVNEYDPPNAYLILEGTKELIGAELKDVDEFEFELKAVTPGAPMPEDTNAEGEAFATNSVTGAFKFGQIKYEATGTFEYQIREIPKDDDKGITYDPTVYKIVVVVDDKAPGTENTQMTNMLQSTTCTLTEGCTLLENHEGKCLVEPPTGDGIEPPAGDGTEPPTGDGTEPPTGDGTEPPAGDGTEPPVGDGTEPPAGDGTEPPVGDGEELIAKVGKKFRNLLMVATGMSSGEGDLEPSGEPQPQSGDTNYGQLHATVKYYVENVEKEKVVFENTYTADPVGVVVGESFGLHINKKIEGRKLKTGEFEFKLTAVNGAPLPDSSQDNGFITTTNDAEKIVFEEIIFTKAGIYDYELCEVIPTNAAYDQATGVYRLNGVVYDAKVYAVRVTVSEQIENGKKVGKLVASTEFLNDDQSLGIIMFNNKYSVDPTNVEISAKKVLNGRALAAGEFVFELEAKADAPMPEGALNGKYTATNTAAGVVSFGNIVIDKAGTYEYKVKEVNGNLSRVTYDNTEYTVIIVATDNGDGTLGVDTTYKVGEEVKEEIVFTNTYKKPSTPKPEEEPEDDEPEIYPAPKQPVQSTGTKTGDSANLAGLFGLLGAAVVGFFGIKTYKRKKQ